MRHVAVSAAVLIAAAVLSGQAAAQDRPAAYVNAEACLVQNVDAAVAASSGAADAAEFLLTYLCAGPVGAATAYEINSELLASGRGMVDTFMAMMPATPEMTEEEIEAWGTFEEEYGGEDMTDETAADAAEAAADAAAAAGDTAEAAAAEAGAMPVLPVFGAAQDPEAEPVDPLEGISVDPVTGQFVVGDNPMGPIILTLIEYQEAAGRMMTGTPPIFLREMAADLIVARRR